MNKRGPLQLTTYELKEDETTLSLTVLKSIYIKKRSEIVYILKNKKLYGIICMGDILRHNQNEITINTSFCYVIGFDFNKAHKIFLERSNINNIPVVSRNGELLADYSRWEDLLFVERNYLWFGQKRWIGKLLSPYNKVYIVRPDDRESNSHIFFLKCLNQFRIRYAVLEKENINYGISDGDVVIFLSEEELRGMQCLWQINQELNGKIKIKQHKEKWITHKFLLSRILQEYHFDVLKKLANFADIPNKTIDEKASLLFSRLRQKGIKCLNIYANNNEVSEYAKHFKEKLAERLQKSPCQKEAPWVTEKAAERFWCELYQLEDYKSGKAQNELGEGWRKGRYQNTDSKYCKVKNGRRVTCYQPEEYIGTIYFFGPCIMFGAFAEDQYTIESFLQKKLLDMGYSYRVENYSSQLRFDSELEDRLMEIGRFSINDIVVYLSQAGEVIGAENCSLWEIYERNQIPPDWVTNWYLHCNHKVYQVLADSIYKLLQPCLIQGGVLQERTHVDFCDLIKEYVYYKYIVKYFDVSFAKKYQTVGAIVMNCNPFSKGHRYLIEQAKQQVEFLIIFVVEEDASLFSFEERYRMVFDGTKDLENVMVVPSGEFILSRNTFEEYFTKVETELIVLNAEYDINIFADYIAEPLHITHRFAGEEPIDQITKIYNETMKKILPQKGITFVEIPRIRVKEKVISASAVREYFKRGEYSKASEMLPETTVSFLMGQHDCI